MTEPEPTSRRERKKQATRGNIATIAIAMFLARGFDEVSVAEIADAADVSKVTVFNYFPAKVDMVFELADEGLADAAGAVRGRLPGQSPLQAVRAYYLEALHRRAEWTCLHDGVEPFARMIWASPTLMQAFALRGHEAEEALAAELARVTGETPWMLSPFEGLDRVKPPQTISHRVVAGMVRATLDQLVRANIGRILSGQTADQAAAAARADGELAFDLLADGIGRYGAV